MRCVSRRVGGLLQQLVKWALDAEEAYTWYVQAQQLMKPKHSQSCDTFPARLLHWFAGIACMCLHTRAHVPCVRVRQSHLRGIRRNGDVYVLALRSFFHCIHMYQYSISTRRFHALYCRLYSYPVTAYNHGVDTALRQELVQAEKFCKLGLQFLDRCPEKYRKEALQTTDLSGQMQDGYSEILARLETCRRSLFDRL